MQTSAGGSVTYGNPDLKAEHSNNFELGARYNGNQWLIDSAVYYSEAKDYIASLICDGSIVCNGNTNSSVVATIIMTILIGQKHGDWK
ncbi:hypothetical protein MUTS15_43190 [Escherichia coli]|nr:hypothetical protein MUTS15_43190 [Escherichia coli]